MYFKISPLFLILIHILIILIFSIFKINIEKNKFFKNRNISEKSKFKLNIYFNIYLFIKKYYFKILIILIVSVISIFRINNIRNNRDKFYNINNINNRNSYFNVKIIEKNEYNNSDTKTYIAKVIDIDINKNNSINIKNNKESKNNKTDRFNNIKIIFRSKKDLDLVNIYTIKGNLVNFFEERNYKGFNERKYYHSKGIDFRLELDQSKEIILNKEYINNNKDLFDYIILIRIKINKYIDRYIKENDIFKALILGDTKNLDEDIKQNFKSLNIYHLFATSGMHINYLVLLLNFIFININKTKFKINIKLKIIIQILILLFFMILIGFSSSISRVVFILIISIILKEFNIKYGFLNSILLSLLIILIINPFIIYSYGLYLSYIATISIYFFLIIEKNLKLSLRFINILKIDEHREWRLRDRILKREKFKINILNNNKLTKNLDGRRIYINKQIRLGDILRNFFKKIIEYIFFSIYISIVIYLSLLPLLIYYFNEITINFFLATLLTSIIFPVIMILGFIYIFIIIFKEIFNFHIFSLFLFKIANLINFVFNLFLKIINFVLELSNNVKSVYYIKSYNIIFVLVYYIIIFVFFYIFGKNISKFTIPRKYFKIGFIKFKEIFFKIKVRRIFILFVLIIFIIYSSFDFLTFKNILNKSFKISFLYVGQGDSSFIVTQDNKTILIDAGSGGKYSYYDYGKEVRRYILKRGYNKINHLFISHFDVDHVGGIYSLIDSLKIDNIYIPKYVGKYLENEIRLKYGNINKEVINKIEEDLNNNENNLVKIERKVKSKSKSKSNINNLELDFIHYYNLKEKVREKNINIIELERGNILCIDKYTKIEILYPTRDLIINNFSNNNSLVFKLIAKINNSENNNSNNENKNKINENFSVLYTGDIEKDAIKKIIELEKISKNNKNKKETINSKFNFNLKSDIFKIPHHGSKNSLDLEFLKLINPSKAIISCGTNNIYKHPHKEILDVLSKFNIEIFRTDIEGEIYFEINL